MKKIFEGKKNDVSKGNAVLVRPDTPPPPPVISQTQTKPSPAPQSGKTPSKNAK